MNKRSVLLALTVLILLCLTTVATFAKPSADTSADMAVASCEVDFNATLEWEWTGSSTLPDSNQVMMSPAVIDINADGTPDIVFSSFAGDNYNTDGHLRAIDGRTGAEIFTVTDANYDVRPAGSVAVGDIDGDNQVEIIAVHEGDRQVMAFEHDGTYKWTSPIGPTPLHAGGASIADLDHDGNPEVVIGAMVLNSDGTLRFQGTAGKGSNGAGPLSIVADLDMDGDQEVIAGNTAYRSDGTIYWQKSEFGDGFSAIGNFDDDDYPEVVVISAKQLTLLEHDGTIKWGPNTMSRTQHGGAPVIADMDGDGELEIGISGNDRYFVFEADGSEKWNATTKDDNSNLTGSSAFDFDGDGAAEIVHSDELKLRIFNGTDGTVLWETDSPSGTTYELPVIVDVDADNHAEIVMVSNNYEHSGSHGIQIYGHSTWPGTRGIWNQHSYHITNINDDGTIPTNETPSWTEHNSYHMNLSSGGCSVPPPSCEYRPPVGGFDPQLEWEWTQSSTLPTSKQVVMTPAVIDLTGDGIPDVIFITHANRNLHENGHLRAINGDDGSEIFSVTDSAYDLYGGSNVAVGDIDLDGQPEILAMSESKEILAFEHDGSFKWRSPAMSGGDFRLAAPAIADLDQDGTPEIVVGATVLNHDGTIRWSGSEGRGDHYEGPLSLVADLDLAGTPEVVAGNTAYRADGTVYWHNSSVTDGFNAIGNFDGDVFPEIALVTEGNVYLLEHDGNVKWGPSTIPGGGKGGAPTIADVDGDGQPEIGVAGGSNYVVFETDGALKWSQPIQDASSNVTGSSVFDFEGDGSAEVVYSDELKLYIYRGSDGTVLWETPSNSRTAYENPVIVDVDADGNAEIVIVTNNAVQSGTTGIQVYGDANDTWVPTRQIWNQHTYHITNVNDDGTIPQNETASWQTHNTYRLNLPTTVQTSAAPDLTASQTTIDDANFPASATITARIGNGGSIQVGAGVEVAFYDGDPEDGGTLIGVTTTTQPLAPGEHEDVTIIWYSPPGGDHTIYVVADDDGTGEGAHNECDETNNDHSVVHTFQQNSCEVDFNAQLEWEWTESSTSPTSKQVVMTPAVIDLTDDGIPDVIFITHVGVELHKDGHLRAINGDDGSEIFNVTDSAYDLYAASNVAVGDIDLDGKPEILAMSESSEVLAFSHDGSFKWRSAVISGDTRLAAPAIADLDEDGTPEIVVGATVLNDDGSIRWSGSQGRGDNYEGPLSLVADLDLAGTPEVVAGNTAYRADGTVYWHNSSVTDGFNAIGNFDGDVFPEIALVTEGNVYLLEHDGNVKWGPSTIPGGGRGGAPTIADVDGDGEAEIGVAGKSNYVVFETDGTLKWSQPIQDTSSNVTGSSTFDFEGDGSAEVVYSDELNLYIYRGSDGTVLWQIPSNNRTAYENPVIVDVDADGNAEIVMVTNNAIQSGTTGIQVYGHSTWPDTRGIWNQHTYHITNVNDDGTIPQNETASWQTHNTYRLNPSILNCGLDLAVSKGNDINFAYPGDVISYTITVENLSTIDASGVVVSDTLPSHTSFISASDGGTEAGGTVTWNLGEVLGDSSITLNLTIRVNDSVPADGRTLTNRISVTDDGSNGPDQNPDDNRDEHVDYVDTSEAPICTGTFPNKQIINGDFDGSISVYPADVDSDGDQDLLGAGQYADDITWWENDGNGAFTEHTIDGDFDGAFSVYADDVDQDGDMDVLGASFGTNEVAWWANNGDGTWTKHSIGTSDRGAYSVRTADVDGDGDQDALGAWINNRITWWANNGDGTSWTEYVIDADFGGAQAVEVADLDADGDIDVLGASRYGNDITWWENSGDGSSWTEHLVDGDFRYAVSVEAADMDGDGDLDLLGSATNDNDITWWENDGNAAGWVEHVVDGEFDGASWATAIDMDYDGDLDVLGAGRDNGEVAWWQNRGGDAILWSKHLVDDQFRGAHAVYAVDLDGNYALDIVAAAYIEDDVAWWRNDCEYAPSEAPDLTISKDDGQSAVRAGELLTYTITVQNVVTTTGASGVVISDSLPANTTFVSASDGGTEASGTVTWSVGDLAAGASATRTLVVRVNDADLAHKTPIINTVSVSDDGTNGDDPTPDNNRDDDIDYVDTSESPICTATYPDKQIINGDFDGSISVYPADVDSDGDQDILGAGQYADDITWWENDGNGAFTEHTIDGDFDGAFSVYADDVDQDGDMDVLGASFGTNEVAWWANNGDGTWTKHSIGTSDRGAYSVRTADVDGDGDQDALGAWINNRITWWANNGDGTSWTEYVIDADFGGAQAVEVADLDADGDIDVLGASRYGNDITWWENSGDGSSWTEHLVDGDFRYAVSVEAADMDGDGDLDLLGSATNDNDITWWENDGNAAGWVEHVVDGEFDGASWATAIDMDYDGDLDVLGAGRDNSEIAWWQNRGGDGTLWKKHVVDDQFRGAHAVYAVDLDGNYALDIVAAAYIEDDVAWWRNDCEYAPDLAVTKDDGLNFVHPGQVITYTIVVDNHSVRDGTGVVLSDTLPADTSFVSASDGGSETGGIVTWNLGTLSGHSSMTRTLTIQVNDPLPVDLVTMTNTVSVADDGANGPDPVPENNSDTDIDQVDHTDQFCEVSFPDKHIIDPEFDGAWDVHAADIDGDGDMDALSAGAEADDITWWENADGAGLTWTEHTIDGFYDKASSVYAVDMDNDGDMDVLGSAELDHDITWWENDGTPRNGGWTEHTVEGGFVGAHDVYPADINGDGFLDVLGAAAVHDRITWWKNDGTPSNGGWVAQHLDTSFDGAYSVYAKDVDSDGDMDILGAAKEGDKLVWWNNTAGDGSAWTEQVIDDTVDGAHEIHAADIDGDGDVDILNAASEDDDITWWENDGSPADGGWTERTVEGNFDGASSVYAIDLDLDGDLDIVGAAQDGHLVGWWENFGDGLYWNPYVVDTDFAGAWSIYGADVDGDTDFDIMGAAFDADDVAWWENKCIDAPELSVSKDDGVTLVRWGDVITYTITGSNAPGQDASGVVMTDILPDHVTFLQASDGGTHSDGTVTWAVGDLPANSSITRTLTVQLDNPIPLDVVQITNTVTINDDGIHGPDPKLDNNSDTDVDEVEHPGHIKGNLRLVGRDNGDTPYYNGATINVIDSNDVVIATTTSDANGDFELNNVPTGPNTPYTIRAEMELFLYAERSVNVIENQTTTMPFLPLWPGDSNGDGKVNIVDLTALTTLINDGADIYGGIQCANGTSWNDDTEALPKQLDFNGNCIVDITDIGLHSGTIAAFFSGTNGSVGEDMPVVQIEPGSPAEAGTPWP